MHSFSKITFAVMALALAAPASASACNMQQHPAWAFSRQRPASNNRQPQAMVSSSGYLRGSSNHPRYVCHQSCCVDVQVLVQVPGIDVDVNVVSCTDEWSTCSSEPEPEPEPEPQCKWYSDTSFQHWTGEFKPEGTIGGCSMSSSGYCRCEHGQWMPYYDNGPHSGTTRVSVDINIQIQHCNSQPGFHWSNGRCQPFNNGGNSNNYYPGHQQKCEWYNTGIMVVSGTVGQGYVCNSGSWGWYHGNDTCNWYHGTLPEHGGQYDSTVGWRVALGTVEGSTTCTAQGWRE